MVGVTIGVLALQGDFAEHLELLASCGYFARPVRSAEDLQVVDSLVIPGGESTTMLKLIDRYDMRDLLVKRISGGMAVLGTCAGAILLAKDVSDGETSLGVLPLVVRRNAYGRQAQSFEADIEVAELNCTVEGVFIRAPVISDAGDAVVMATWANSPVMVRSGNQVACTFHPELAGEDRVHRWFVEQVCGGEG
ncbi:MAG: pyridoxal 5'-phosphate synthase glutaminase subunit PdxT [Actinomycetota bacterium]